MKLISSLLFILILQANGILAETLVNSSTLTLSEQNESQFKASYFSWYFMNGSSLNRGKANDSFAIQNVGLTYINKKQWETTLWIANSLSWDEEGRSKFEISNPFIEWFKFSWKKFENGAHINLMGQVYFPLTDDWKENGRFDLWGFYWVNYPLYKLWEVEYHGNPRYFHHNVLQTKTLKGDGSVTIEGNPGFTYLQEIKIRNKTTKNIKVFQLLGLQSNWFHKANDSANYTESLEIETGLEWYPTKGIWLQASARQNIDEKPYFSNFKLYKEDQLEYHLRLFVQL